MLNCALTKFEAFGYLERGDFLLVYPNSWQVVETIPGHEYAFIVSGYQAELGARQYARVILYICAPLN